MAKNEKKLMELRLKEIELLNSLKDIWEAEQRAFKGYYSPYVDTTIEEWKGQVDYRINTIHKYMEM